MAKSCCNKACIVQGGKISFFGAYAVYDENGIFRDWCV